MANEIEKTAKRVVNSAVKPIKKTVDKSVNKIEGAFKEFTKIIEFFKCPIKIFKNYGTCYKFHIGDILAAIVWLIVCAIIAICIYPFVALFGIIACSITKDVCFDYRFKSWMPTLMKFKFITETIMSPMFNSRILYRNKSDMDKCYCFKPLTYVLWPLKNYKPFLPSDQGIASGSVFVAFVIITGIIIYSVKNRQLQVTGN